MALTEATTKFSENVLDSTNAYELLITEESKLAGLPPAAVAAARASAESKGKAGWRFTLHGPSYLALMTYLDDGPIREQVWRAYNLRGAEEPFNNRGLLKKILDLRREKAVLLGFRDFADLVLDDRMAHTGDTAQKFLEDLRVLTEPRFKVENAALEKFAGRALEPWDVGYWAEKQRAALYDFDEEALRPYFSLDNVVKGMFEIFGRDFWDSRGAGDGRSGVGCRGEVLRDLRCCERGEFGIVLRGLVSAGEQARRGLDGFADYGESGGTSSALGVDLRESDASGGWQAGAVDAS